MDGKQSRAVCTAVESGILRAPNRLAQVVYGFRHKQLRDKSHALTRIRVTLTLKIRRVM